ncbi:MAG: DUF2490 domain-containing protein [Reichenbachiella sp.]
MLHCEMIGKVIYTRKIWNAFIVFSGILFLSLPLSAQEDQVGNWLMYFGLNRVSEKLSIHSEVQYRDHTWNLNDIEQLLLRVGVNYHLDDNKMLTAGYGNIRGHVYGSEQDGPEVEEHRIWEQFILLQYLNRIKLEHRFRAEQRWQNEDYANRFRYRLMLFLPLNKPKIEKGSLFLGVYNEIFINGESEYYDRNRLYSALGYQFNKSTSLQLGLLHQHVNNNGGKLYLQTALFFNPDFRKNNN